MKVIIAGGRNLPEDQTYWRLFDFLRDELGLTEVVCGGARGGDAIGRAWAEAKGIPVKLFPADWKAHGKSAGFRRNSQMAEYGEALIALPGGVGTKMMINLARRRGLRVYDTISVVEGLVGKPTP